MIAHQPKRPGIATRGIQVSRARIAGPLANGTRAGARGGGARAICALNSTRVPTP
jgi:hypothetical protein